MMNYIKSEFYRLFRTKIFLYTIGVFCLLILGLLGGMYLLFGESITTSLVYSILLQTPLMYGYTGMALASVFYEGGSKNGNLKNTVANGVTRPKIFLAQSLVATVLSTLIMFLVLALLIGTTELLFLREGPVGIPDLLREVPAVYLSAVAYTISMILLLELFDKTFMVVLIWTSFWMILPRLLKILGMRVDFLSKGAMLFPSNFFAQVQDNSASQQVKAVWDSAAGMTQSLLIGAGFVLIFLVLGVTLLRRRDLR